MEVYRADLACFARPLEPGQYTTDQDLPDIVRSVDIEV